MSTPNRSSSRLLVLSLSLALGSCGGGDAAPPSADGRGAETITADDIRTHVEVLASDEFGGRAPSSPGEQLTVDYLVERFEAMGLEPGNGESWFQEVPLVDITADPATATFSVTGDGGTVDFAYGDEVVTWTTRVVDSASVEDSEMVFVGYGIVAPEYGWNDYEGLDVAGKTVVILVNDPGFATQDPELFTGNAMTYYGRWSRRPTGGARSATRGPVPSSTCGPKTTTWAGWPSRGGSPRPPPGRSSSGRGTTWTISTPGPCRPTSRRWSSGST